MTVRAAWGDGSSAEQLVDRGEAAPGEIVVSESRRDASLTDTDSIEILLDTFNRQVRPQGLRNLITDWTERLGVDEWRVEKNGFQAFLTQDREITQYLASRGVRLLEHETRQNKWDPDWGIASMEMLFRGYEDGIALIQKFDWEKGGADIASTLAHLRAMPECNGRAGGVGFCFGGVLSYLLAATARPGGQDCLPLITGGVASMNASVDGRSRKSKSVPT